MILNYVVLLFLASSIESLKIAVGMTFGSHSHTTPMFNALELLHQKGHQIVYAAPQSALNFSTDYPYVENALLDVPEFGLLNATFRSEFMTQFVALPYITLSDLAVFFVEMNKSYKDLLVAFIKFLQSSKVDYILCDFFAFPCIDAAAHVGVKVGGFGALGLYGLGEAWYVPPLISPVSQEHWVKSFWTRAAATSQFLVAMPKLLSFRNYQSEIKGELGITIPSIDAILSKSLYIGFVMYGLEYPRLTAPNCLAVSPLLKAEFKPLDNETQALLDELYVRGKKVLFISFGSIVDGHLKVVNGILDVLSMLLTEDSSVTVLWATSRKPLDKSKLPVELSERVILKQWVNQRAVLAHPAVQLFLTHGGYSSVHESLYAGKAMLVLPLFADQFVNANLVLDAGVGQVVQKTDIVPSKVVEQISSLFKDAKDPSSKLFEKLARLQRIAVLNSETNLVVVANSVEMAATVGVDHLVPIVMKISFFELYSGYAILFPIFIGIALVLRRYLRATHTKNNNMKALKDD